MSRLFFYCCYFTLVIFACGATGGVAAEETTKPIFEDGEAQIVPEFEDVAYWIRHDLWVETAFDSDGDDRPDRMHVSVTRPRETETQGLKLPVIYVTSPYFAGTGPSGTDYFWDPKQEVGQTPTPRRVSPDVERKGRRPIISKSHAKTWVPRGFVVVHSSSPGTGLSQGCPTVGGDNESLAPKAVIDWLCGRAKGYTSPSNSEEVKAYWSTGKVGMTGTSYNGTLPIAAATTGVEGLEVIIPIAPNTSYYHYYRSNGLVRHPGGFIGEDIDCLFDFIHSGDEQTREFCRCTVRDEEMAEGFDRRTGDYNDFWRGRDYLNDMEPFRAALLMCHAFNDWNVMPEHSVRIYNEAKRKGVPCKIYFHQGGHGGAPPLSMMNRWFTHYLHGVSNDVKSGPRAFIVREQDSREEPTSYEDYPNPKAKPVTLHLHPGAPEAGALREGKLDMEAKEALVDNYSFPGESLARAESTNHRLIYCTETLKKPVHLSGIPEITIRMSSDRPAANVSVWLVSLPWNEGKDAKITDNIITRGWADPQNVESSGQSAPLVPGEFYDIRFKLQPDDQIIPAGQQIALMIISSDREFTLWPMPGTVITVDLNGTSLSLPVVDGFEGWQSAFADQTESE